MSASHPVTDRSPWYRQPLVWMIILIPLSAVVGGMVTLYLAATTQDGLVEDDYYWRGKAINRVLRRDQWALAHHLRGQLQRQRDGGELVLYLQSGPDVELPASLDLDMRYATRALEDQVITLERRAPGTYAGHLPANLHIGKWYSQVQTDQWRLVGIIHMPEFSSIELRPATD